MPVTLVLLSCAHAQTREAALTVGAQALACSAHEALLTEFSSDEATVEGCEQVAHVSFFNGRWQLWSRCRYKTLEAIRSCCSPNPGGRRICAPECKGFEACAAR